MYTFNCGSFFVITWLCSFVIYIVDSVYNAIDYFQKLKCVIIVPVNSVYNVLYLWILLIICLKCKPVYNVLDYFFLIVSGF